MAQQDFLGVRTADALVAVFVVDPDSCRQAFWPGEGRPCSGRSRTRGRLVRAGGRSGKGRPTPPVPSARATLSKLQGESGQLADAFKSAQDQKAAIAIIARQGQVHEMPQHLNALRNAKRDRQPLRTRYEPLSPSFEGAAWTLTEMVLPAVQKVRDGASNQNKANERSRH